MADLTTELGTGVPQGQVSAGPEGRGTASGALDLRFDELDELLALIADVVLLVDDEGSVLYASPMAQQVLGHSPDELAGRPLADLVHPDDRPVRLASLLGEHAPDMSGRGVVMRVRTASEAFQGVTAHRVSGSHLARRNMTALFVRPGTAQRTLDALRHRLAFEDLLTRIASSFILRPNEEIDDAIDDALADIGAFGGVDRVYVYIANDERSIVENTNTWTAEPEAGHPERPRVIHQSETPAWMAQLRSMESLYLPRTADLHDDWSAERSLLERLGVRSALAVPLADEGRFLGFVGFDSMTSERLWSDDHVGLLNAAAGIISQALARRAAEQRFELAFTDAPLGMALNRPDGSFVQVNRTYCELVGRSEEELLGENMIDLIESVEHQRVLDYLVQFENAEIDHLSISLRARRGDGELRWFRAHTAAVRKAEGSIRYLLTHLEDITERHAQEIDLRVSEERYRSLVENSPAIVTRFDRDGRMVYVSPAFSELGVMGVDEIIGHKSDILGPAADVDRWNVALRRVFDTGERHDTEWEIAVGDDALWFQSRAVPEFDENGEVEFVLVMNTDITALKRSEAELAHQAMHDPLTGLANRALLLDHLANALAQSVRRPEQLALLFLDLDRFKVINDSLGHSAGDRLLVEVGKRIYGALRGGDTVARLGGDEFVVLLPDVVDADEAVAIAERLLEAIRVPVQIDGDEVFSTASIGIAFSDGDELDATAEALLRDADTAMYRAKSRGRNRLEIFDEELRRQATSRMHLEMFLRRAVELGELEVHYQPEVDLVAGRLIGAEALARWRHPTEGLLEAGSFIALAEETGLILDVGAWVLREACRQAGRWHREHPGRLGTLRVNLSARQITQPDLVDTVVGALDDGGIEPSALCLEITETALMGDPVTSLEVLTRLRSLGVELAIDDFGTGYSSLSYLRRFPVDVLKIDKSFVDGLDTEDDEGDDTAIAAAILSLGQTLGLRVVAEGVETPRQLAVLRRLGCTRAQGYLFSPPVPADRFWYADRIAVGMFGP